jgi:aryl-alcohol dehydrogenase-like predicted oxidoreductase
MVYTSVSKEETVPDSPLTLPPLMIGGAVFSYHYNEDVSKVDTEAILSRAISSGANGEATSFCIDRSLVKAD